MTRCFVVPRVNISSHSSWIFEYRISFNQAEIGTVGSQNVAIREIFTSGKTIEMDELNIFTNNLLLLLITIIVKTSHAIGLIWRGHQTYLAVHYFVVYVQLSRRLFLLEIQMFIFQSTCFFFGSYNIYTKFTLLT